MLTAVFDKLSKINFAITNLLTKAKPDYDYTPHCTNVFEMKQNMFNQTFDV